MKYNVIILASDSRIFRNSIIYKEWHLWSKCFGKVIVINGVSSAGKSTLSNHLIKRGYSYVSLDQIYDDIKLTAITKVFPFISSGKLLAVEDIIYTVCSETILNKDYTQEQLNQLHIISQNTPLLIAKVTEDFANYSHVKIIEIIAERAKKYIFRGENVVVDIVEIEEKYLNMLSIFLNYNCKTILLYTPLERNLLNCFKRNFYAHKDNKIDYRSPYMILSDFMKFYKLDYSAFQGITIDRDKIMDQISCIEESLTLLPKFIKFTIRKNIINEIKSLLLQNDKISIPSLEAYDMVITLNQMEYEPSLVAFLIDFAELSHNDDVIMSPEILPNFVIFYKHPCVGRLYNYVHGLECITQAQLVNGKQHTLSLPLLISNGNIYSSQQLSHSNFSESSTLLLDITKTSKDSIELDSKKQFVLKKIILPQSIKLENDVQAWDIDVLGDGNCLFYSLILGYLLPHASKEQEFFIRYSKIFSTENANALRFEMRGLHANTMWYTKLTQLVNGEGGLRQKLSEYFLHSQDQQFILRVINQFEGLSTKEEISDYIMHDNVFGNIGEMMLFASLTNSNIILYNHHQSQLIRPDASLSNSLGDIEENTITRVLFTELENEEGDKVGHYHTIIPKARFSGVDYTYADIMVNTVSDIKYDNPLLNHENFLEILKAIKGKGGALVITELMNLQTSDSLELLKIKDTEVVVNTIIAQNYFLHNERGREFLKVVENNFDNEDLLKVLVLGREQDVAEQIVHEAEAQSVNIVVSVLLGKELPAANTATGSLENIIGTQELNQLQLVPSGILNGWSNKAYLKGVEYIDNLAKNLDALLNTGKSGSQVAVTLALLEEWLEFAASGQRFIGGRPPYYNPDDNDDWSYGDSGSSGGNNNSSAGNFDSQNEFVGLILPVYNSTYYNDSNHQM